MFGVTFYKMYISWNITMYIWAKICNSFIYIWLFKIFSIKSNTYGLLVHVLKVSNDYLLQSSLAMSCKKTKIIKLQH